MATGGLAIIQSMKHKLPPSERKLADYILAHPHKAIESTVNEISALANSSDAAVIRLCKSLGLKGFQDLKMRVAGDLAKPTFQATGILFPTSRCAPFPKKRPVMPFKPFRILQT